MSSFRALVVLLFAPYVWANCRSDICGDIANDCCAPGSEQRSCRQAGYTVTPGGTSSYRPCIGMYGQSAIYQCCDSSGGRASNASGGTFTLTHIHGRGCSSYIHMDDSRYGRTGGSYTLQQCAEAVQRLNGREGCIANYFFFESSGHCNCPRDGLCSGGPNNNAGGSGQLYQFTSSGNQALDSTVIVAVGAGGGTVALVHRRKGSRTAARRCILTPSTTSTRVSLARNALRYLHPLKQGMQI